MMSVIEKWKYWLRTRKMRKTCTGLLGIILVSLVIFQDSSRRKTDVQTDTEKTKLIFSTKLKSRLPWSKDSTCQNFSIRHLVPRSRPVTALASYPGSGNTWLRYLIEGASGIFTGSRYKDLQIQMYGLWGEIREWTDGTTIVQKTHDSHPNHVRNDFGGHGILILRNPYDAILSDHNFLFGGHMGQGPAKSFARKDWETWVTIELNTWLGMAINWTINSNPDKLLVINYEEVKENTKKEMENILNFLDVPIDQNRLDCLIEHKNGFFQRKLNEKARIVPFKSELRAKVDDVIDKLSRVLVKFGYPPLPTSLYGYYRRNDEEILKDIDKQNQIIRQKIREKSSSNEDGDDIDQNIGSKMVLEQYFKWLDVDSTKLDMENTDDAKTLIMKQLYGSFKKYSNQNTVTGLSHKAEKLLTMAVELWPSIQKPFAKDPIIDVIEREGGDVATIEEILNGMDKILE